MSVYVDNRPPFGEIREQLGALDEVVAKESAFVHLEQMDDNAWWLRIDLKDGRAIVVNFWNTRSRTPIHARAEWDPGPKVPA